MKTIFLTGLMFLMSFSSITAQRDSTYTNPVIPGDHSDCTLSQVGDDFYSTGSSFNPTPVIYHSTDLVHWEAIAQPVSAAWSQYGDSPSGGCWGGQVVFYKNKWWDFFGRSNQMYFVTANKPQGPWSTPTLMNTPSGVPGLGEDNSIFIDTDSTWYLLSKNGQPNNWIVQLGSDGQPAGAVYDLTWLNPAPDYPYSWAEGPVMWKYKGYYFYAFARNVAGGQKVMRSRTLTGDSLAWSTPVDFFNENDPGKYSAIFSNPNHSSAAVLLSDSTSWVLHPVWARANGNEWYGQGRQGLLNQVVYNADTFPVAFYPDNKSFIAPKLPSSGIPWMVPKSDFFNSDTLNPEWSFLGYTATSTHSLTQRPGWLRLLPKSATKSNTVIKTDPEHNYSLITRLDFNPTSTNDEAGIRLINGMENLWAKVYSSFNSLGHKVICFSFDKTYYETDNTIGNIVWLKMVRVNHILTGFYSADGINWIQVGKGIDVSSLDRYTLNYNGWCGNRQGLYVQGTSADFDLYIYRDAYTPILAECPANHYGTVRTTETNGIYQLDSINNNDWALYAGVEFGNSNYLKAPKTIEITASSGGSGGTVEVWLDSLNGTKIADCAITGTGDWNTFQTFSAPVTKVQGRHDVYLLFKGVSPYRLFKLKWIQFTSINGPKLVSASINNNDTLMLKLDQPVFTPSLPSGLTIESNGSQNIPISGISLAPGDSSQLIITLASSIADTDNLTISYDTGSVANSYGISLAPFNGVMVDNRLPGAIPKIKLLETKNQGDTIWMYMSKKMNSMSQHISDFTIGIQGKADIPLKFCDVVDYDSTIIYMVLQSRVYYEDNVTLSYSGTSLSGINGGSVAPFTAEPVQNTSTGYPPKIVSSKLRNTGNNYRLIDLVFDRPLMDASSEMAYFTITINGQPGTIQSLVMQNDTTLTFTFTPYVHAGDTIMMSYSGGNVQSVHQGMLQDFSNYEIANTVPVSDLPKILNDKNSNIKVFPNPANNNIRISWQTPFNSLSIFSTDGKLILQKSFDYSVRQTSLTVNLPAGTYILTLKNKKVYATKKIIIE